MFDTLVVTKTEKPGARSLLSLPAALTFHAVAGMGFLFFSLYAPDTLPAPPYAAVLPAMPAVPVTLVNRDQVRGLETKRSDRAAQSDGGLKAPPTVPTGVTPPEPSGPPSGPAGPDVPGGLPSDLVGPGDSGQVPVTAPVPVLNVWEVLEPPHLVSQMSPEYPPALRVLGLGGKVVLEVVVDENGDVAQVKVTASPHPLLAQAAEEAVRRWKYTRPVSASGGSVRVVQTVVVNFTLR